MAADLFETFTVTLIAAILLGISTIGAIGIDFPLALAGMIILASVLGSFFVRLGRKQVIMNALYKGIFVSLIVSAILFYPVIKYYFPENYLNYFLNVLVGLVIAGLMVVITDYYTAKKFRPVKSIAEALKSGHATNIIIGLKALF